MEKSKDNRMACDTQLMLRPVGRTPQRSLGFKHVARSLVKWILP